MLRDFTSLAGRLHQARLHEWREEAKRNALRNEARAARRLRTAIGHGLIALGQRIAEPPTRHRQAMERAA